MYRFFVLCAAAMLVVSAVAESSQAQLFRGRRAANCCPQPVCCPAPAPVCCPAPAPAPVCCPAPAPVCCPAPAPVCCAAPAPTCCEPAACGPCERRLVRRARRSSCCTPTVMTASYNACGTVSTGCSSCGTVSAVYGGTMVSGCPTCSTTMDSGTIVESTEPSVAPPAPAPEASSPAPPAPVPDSGT